jgi:hypothetical protein
MNRKPLAIVAGVIAAILGAYVTRQAIDLFNREPSIPQDLANRAWVEQSLGSGFTFDVPWPLQPQTLPLPPELTRLIAESRTASHEGDGINVMAMHMSFVPGTPTSLEGAADGAIQNLKTNPGTASVEGSKNEISIAGERAFEIEATIKRTRGVPLRMRGVVFGDSPQLYQIIFVCRADQTAASAVWEKLRGSVRRKAG